MNPLTRQLLERLWEGAPTFKIVESRLTEECQSMSPAEAAVIGRDLILRRNALFTDNFHIAAWLASDGMAGNDGFMDFTDCVALLPDDRYQAILANPDELINDPVSSGFDELYLVAMVTKVFDRAMLDGDASGGLLHYLVLGDKTEEHGISTQTEEDIKKRLPLLYAKFGHLLRPSQNTCGSSPPDWGTVTLNDFIR